MLFKCSLLPFRHDSFRSVIVYKFPFHFYTHGFNFTVCISYFTAYPRVLPGNDAVNDNPWGFSTALNRFFPLQLIYLQWSLASRRSLCYSYQGE